MKKRYRIDGDNFSTFDEFCDEVSRVLIPNSKWGRNLPAFNDILRGGFATPDGGCVLEWKNSEESRKRLGYDCTVAYRQENLKRCHPGSRERLRNEIEALKRREGTMLFETLVEIIRDRAEGGKQAEDGVVLLLL